MYVLLEPNSFSTSLHKSRDISSDDMFANVHSAKPTAYMFEWFISLTKDISPIQKLDRTVENTYFLSELVTSVNTSWFSSSKSIIPRYPSLLSANLGLATSLRHSIWPK